MPKNALSGNVIIKRYIFLNLIYLALFSAGVQAAYPGQDETRTKIETVVIDPGHGGKDPGAVGRHHKEKDIVLSISLKLGHYIEKHIRDVRVIYTRTKDEFVPLHKRAAIANSHHADLFISIHANSWESARTYGAETYVMGMHTNERNLALAMKENSVITLEDNYTTRYEGFNPNSPESYIMFTLMQKTYLKQSLNFASYVQYQFRERALRKDRGVKPAGFLVLWQTTMPSILIEAGYLSNPGEEQYLASEQGQDYLASAIFRAFRDYKNAIESKSIFTVQESSREQRRSQNPGNEQKTKELAKDNKLYYMVQIFSATTPLNPDTGLFGKYNEIYEIKLDNLFKYLVGKNKEYEQAVDLVEKVRADFPDAFIVAVRNGRIIPLRETINNIM